MSSADVTLREEDGGVAVLAISRPPVNALTPKLLKELFAVLEDVQNRPKVKAIVLEGANDRFSSGFDIGEFAKPGGVSHFSADDWAALHRSLSTLLESGAKPTVAAMDRMALGGGLELAMACNARVCTPGTSLGLPELRLGIIPGAGGTQRLPRLVGLQQGLDMMLDSQVIQTEEALELGLVDVVVPGGQLLEAAKKLALEVAVGQRPRQAALERSGKLGGGDEAGEVLAAAAERAAGIGRHAQLCVEAVRWGVERGGSAGVTKEAECFQAAAALDHHKAMIHMYFAYRAFSKLTGRGEASAAAPALRHFLLFWLFQLRGALKRLLGRS